MNGRFSQKVAVVTGVNDRGIGGAIARRLAEEGACVVALWQDRPSRLIARLNKRGHQLLDLECDITQQASVTAAVEQILKQYGRIDVLVNNAGVDHSGTLSETSDDDWQRVIDVNLTGSMRMIRSCLPYIPSGTGAIINLASVLGMAGCGGFPAYSATKAGIIGLTQSLASELAPQGIRAVCVAPALVLSPMTHKYVLEMGDDVEEQLRPSHPLGAGTPEDVAAAVAFVASNEARWITGITLPLGWASMFPLPMDRFLDTPTDPEQAIVPGPWITAQQKSQRAAG